MRPVITKLSSKLINMIAAGEVVERPLSVVKELVENSIDAKSTKIKVELKEGGIKEIIVTDNGIGLTKEEMILAVSEHATSKIKSEDDLFNISTLGFRGEALASIKSVAKFKIASFTEISQMGFYYEFVDNEIYSSGSCVMPKGTKITVTDLFYNTPARLQHLKSQQVESSIIIDYLYKCALAHPEINFTLVNNDKVIYQTNSTNDLIEIIGETYNQSVVKNMIYFEGQNNLYKIYGYTSNNQVFRGNKNAITILVNNRVIKNQSLIYGILDCYKSIIPIGKYPITILKISALPSVIDVNVHPSKLEIRFTDEYLLRTLITSTITKALSKKELIYNDIVTEFNEKPLFVQEKTELNYDSSSLNWDQFVEKEPVKAANSDLSEKVIVRQKEEQLSIFSQNINENLENNISSNVKCPDNFLYQRNHFRNFTYIGQFLKTYLIFEYLDQLYLIDQHAAAERILYEKISESFDDLKNAKIDAVPSVELLVPLIITFNIVDVSLIIASSEKFKKYGLHVEHFGSNTFKVSVIPTWIKRGCETESVIEMIELIIHDRNLNESILYDNIAKQMSCKKAIKANMYILNEEVSALLDSLDRCKMPFTCPHGRPSLMKFTKNDLEKLFKRVI